MTQKMVAKPLHRAGRRACELFAAPEGRATGCTCRTYAVRIQCMLTAGKSRCSSWPVVVS